MRFFYVLAMLGSLIGGLILFATAGVAAQPIPTGVMGPS